MCKIGKLVISYNVTGNNKTASPRAYYALYIGLSDSGTGHLVFKLTTKKVVTTPKYKPKPIIEDVITIVDEVGRKEGMPKGK